MKEKKKPKERKVEFVLEDEVIVWISESGSPLSTPGRQCHPGTPGSLDAKGSTAYACTSYSSKQGCGTILVLSKISSFRCMVRLAGGSS